jgi:hypothetical protein
MTVRRLLKGALSIALLFALLASFLIFPTTTALALGTPNNPDLYVNGCALVVQFAAAGAFNYEVQIWDDNVIATSGTAAASGAGEVMTFNLYVAGIKEITALGVGVYIYQNGVEVYENDPYNFLTVPCNEGVIKFSCTLTDGAYQVAVPAGAQLFWGASYEKPVTPITFIPAGSAVTVTYDNGEGWYQILWACQYLWIQAADTVPNPAAISKPFPWYATNK